MSAALPDASSSVPAGAPPLSGRVVHPAGEGIVYGPGTMRAELAKLLDRCRIERPMVLTTPSVQRSGLLDDVLAMLGDRPVATFAGSREHTPEPVVAEAAAVARGAGVDGLISLGGSSVVDLTKGVAMVLAEGDDLARLRVEFHAGQPGRNRRPELDAPKLPHVALPTTLSGAEFTGAAGITDPVAGVKQIYRDAKLTPRWVILDPELTRATPAALWAATGMKALADTIEVLCSRRATPLSDAVAAAGLGMLAADLVAATGDVDDLAARGRCQFAVGMVLPQLAMVGVGLVAGLRHQLGGGLGVAHGVASTIVLPHVVRWNAPAAEPALRRAAAAVGVEEIEQLIATVERLTIELGLPSRLRDVGVTRDDLAPVARHVLGDGALATNPRPVSDAASVLEVLRAAW